MADLVVTLPEPLKSWAERQALDGRYADASDYIRDLIRRDQDLKSKIAAMQELVDEGLESGISDQSMDDILRSLNNTAAE